MLDCAIGDPRPTGRDWRTTITSCLSTARGLLMDALRLACSDMVNWLSNDYGYDKMDAYQLLGQSAVIKVTNVVDLQYSVACAVDKKYLPKRWRRFGSTSRRNPISGFPGILMRHFKERLFTCPGFRT
jgi:hypothetical protein